MQPRNLENFYWIGGCPSGGKTTLAGEISKAANITIISYRRTFVGIRTAYK